jgi:cytochrome c-type biogenesis protein CcmF
MIAELGHFCLCLALMLAAAQACMPLLQRALAPHTLLPLVKPMAAGGFMLVTAAGAALVYSYAISDFSVMNVVLNSSMQKPLLYKITGSWGNHEGSMLLWAWILAAYGFALALWRPREAALTHLALGLMGLLSAGILAFILFTSNPFLRVWPAPAEGQDLNPLLQDIGLAFHPPTLYVGYVGFAAVFCFAIAGMLRGRLDAAWARQAHPFILIPWSALTLGIGAGSWWAYRELGWGGFWFWDPVENVSLLPWLTGTALLHANLVLEKRGQLGRWVALLAILSFGMSLIGTFIVRSGLITSVHAFASDPARGLFILAYCGAAMLGAFAVFSFCPLAASKPPQLASRSGLILIGNLLLTACAATVLMAILYPVLLPLLGLPAVSVGPDYFNRTFLPLGAPLLVLAALAPLLAWDRFTRAQLKTLLLRLAPALLGAALLVLSVARTQWVLGVAGVALAAWLLLGCAYALRRALRTRQLFTSTRGWRHMASLTAHTGLALLALGITTTALGTEKYDAALSEKPLMLGAYELRLTRATQTTQGNYQQRRAEFAVYRHGAHVTTLAPELRYYGLRGMQTTEAAIHSTPLRDLYLVIGDRAGAHPDQPAIGVQFLVIPGQQLIWIACLLMAGGGAISMLAALIARTENRP